MESCAFSHVHADCALRNMRKVLVCVLGVRPGVSLVFMALCQTHNTDYSVFSSSAHVQ